MQVFMRNQLQKPAVSARLREVAAPVDEHRAVVVLQTAVSLINQVQHQQVLLSGGAFNAHQAATSQADPLQIREQIRKAFQQPQPATRLSAPADQPMGHAGHAERPVGVRPNLQWTVQQLIEIPGREPRVWIAGQ